MLLFTSLLQAKKLFSSIIFSTLQRAKTGKLLSPKFMHEFLRQKSHQQLKFTSSAKARVNSLVCLLFILREGPVYHSSPLVKLSLENTKPLAKSKKKKAEAHACLETSQGSYTEE